MPFSAYQAGQPLEAGRPMPERLLAASQRVLDTEASVGGKGGFLRPYQLPAHDNFGHYLMDLATSPENDSVSPFCRIVLPPRTGKTVIAASIIQLTGLCSVFVVPTKTLVTQTAREFAALLPGIPVGFFYGETQTLVPNGINISTYAMLQRHFDGGRLPEWIRGAGLVFLDEAHHVMTPRRLTTIHDAFDEKALRIAITATPNYADQRRLHRYFPKLIHEIDLVSALDDNLLAPTRMWLATVDVDASVVRIVAGDYEQETLGRLMSASPFFKAVELFRYSKSHIDIPAIITCSSRQQASDLWYYLKKHRPRNRPDPGLILGETPGHERERLLAGFSKGKTDTLIQVGVLIEGWNAPHCKLLLDLAPSLSLVRATQKYFRVMTPYRNMEARIIIILPECMQRPPILPIDLMLQPGETYTCGDLISPDSEMSARPRRAIDNLGETPIRSVQTKSQVVARVAFTKPGLDPGNAHQIRRVLLSCPSFSLKKAPGVRRFQRFLFKHPLFTGTGDALLRYLSVAPTKAAYLALLIRAFPEISATYFLADSCGLDVNRHSCRRDFDYIRTKAMAPNDNKGRPVEPLADALHMLCGGAREMASPEDCLLIREKIDKLLELMSELDERAQWVLKYRLGLYGEPELTWEQIGILFDITRERVRQIYLRNVKILSLKYRRRTGDWHPSAKVYSEPPDLIALISYTRR